MKGWMEGGWVGRKKRREKELGLVCKMNKNVENKNKTFFKILTY